MCVYGMRGMHTSSCWEARLEHVALSYLVDAVSQHAELVLQRLVHSRERYRVVSLCVLDVMQIFFDLFVHPHEHLVEVCQLGKNLQQQST